MYLYPSKKHTFSTRDHTGQRASKHLCLTALPRTTTFAEDQVSECVAGNVTMEFKPDILKDEEVKSYTWIWDQGHESFHMFAKFEPNVSTDLITYFEDFHRLTGRIFHNPKEPTTINITDLRESDEAKYYLEIRYANFENYTGYNIYLRVKEDTTPLDDEPGSPVIITTLIIVLVIAVAVVMTAGVLFSSTNWREFPSCKSGKLNARARVHKQQIKYPSLFRPPPANSLQRVDPPYRVHVALSHVRNLPVYSLQCPIHLLFVLFYLPSVTCNFTV
uniref:Uncharacterized protein n=1 Tax=Magallana gigas TaxID=29159 RepID=K1PS04_MAGGI